MNLLIDMIKENKKYNEYIENIKMHNSPVMITGLTFASKSFFLASTISSIIKERKSGDKEIYYYIVENEIDIEKQKRDIEYSRFITKNRVDNYRFCFFLCTFNKVFKHVNLSFIIFYICYNKFTDKERK